MFNKVNKTYRYFLTQRPFTVGSVPKMDKIVNSKEFMNKSFVPTIGQEAWGYVEYRESLDKNVCKQYELKEGYDFSSFLDPKASSIRKISPFFLEGDEKEWADENLQLIEAVSNSLQSEIIFVKKEIEKTGKVHVEYFAINQSLMHIDEFVSELVGKMSIDFSKCNNKWYINLYNGPFTCKIDEEDFSGYDMEKYVFEDINIKNLPSHVSKYISKQIKKEISIIPLPEIMYVKTTN